MPIIAVKIIEIVAQQFNTKWPDKISIGYASGDENNGLPGTLKYRDKFSQVGYKIGSDQCLFSRASPIPASSCNVLAATGIRRVIYVAFLLWRLNEG